MDKKLIAVLTTVLLAMSVANLLLSVGIVTLLLGQGSEAASQSPVSAAVPAVAMSAGNGTQLLNATPATAASINNSTEKLPANGLNGTPVPETGPQMTPPAGMQMPPSGMTPPTGEMPQMAQSSTSAQAPSGTGQTPPAGMQMPGSSLSASSSPQTATGYSLPVSGLGTGLPGIGSFSSTSSPKTTQTGQSVTPATSWVFNHSSLFGT